MKNHAKKCFFLIDLVECIGTFVLVMEDDKEQTKQLIAIELEHARLLSSAVMPLATSLLGILFASQLLSVSTFGRLILSGIIVILLAIAFAWRDFYITKAKNLIKKL